MENNAFGIFKTAGGLNVPGDGLALPVGVGCEIDYLGLLGEFESSSTTASLPFTIS